MFKINKIITKVFHWCKLFKSKRGFMGSDRSWSGPPGQPADKTNVITKRSDLMNQFFIKLCSGRFKKAVREKVTPILRKVAGETKNEFDNAVVKYLEETFKPDVVPEETKTETDET